MPLTCPLHQERDVFGHQVTILFPNIHFTDSLHFYRSLYLSQRAFQVSNLRTNPFYRKHTNTKSHPPSGFATFAERHSMKKGG